MLDFPRWKVWLVAIATAVGILLAVPSLVPASAWPSWLPSPRISLGLDLSGGSHILLEADTASVATQRIEQMEEIIRVEMRRADPRIAIGDISTQGGQLSFMVRDPAQVDAAVELLRRQTMGVATTGQRDWEIGVVDSSRIIVTPTESGLAAARENAMEVAIEVVRRRIDELGTREPTVIRQGDNRIVVQVPGLANPEQLINLLGRTATLEFKLVDLQADPAQIAAGRAPIGSEIVPYPDNPGGAPAIAVKRQVMVSGDQLIDATQTFDPQTGEPAVSIRFDGAGGARFARVTQQNVGRPFAMILDGVVLSAPNINEPILGGQAQIVGSFSVETANELAIALRSGKLPVALEVVQRGTVGPELGADSIRLGVIACIVAAAAVMGFMFVTYGGFALFANIALVLNVLIILGIMAVFNATLTLPGLAGFVLTIGAAVDANVLINERIREEQRRGRKLIDAVSHGFTEASTAIFDANITNVIAGVLMFSFGSGPIKGFAVVLMIGIATSYFTAVTVVRLMVSTWLRRARPRELVL